MAEGMSLSVRVAEAVADREDVEPHELTPPLHAVVDTEALDSLFGPSTPDHAPATVEFSYQGYTVRVDGQNTVRLTDAEPVAGPDRKTA